MILAEKINKQAQLINKNQRIYCQINIGKDPNKQGFSTDELKNNINKIITLPHLTLEGIMTILPLKTSNEKTKKLYNKTKQIKNKISKEHNIDLELSMGMSNDYTTAIKCGATIIRIGSQLFGERK